MHLSIPPLPTAFTAAGASGSQGASGSSAPKPKWQRQSRHETVNAQFRFQTEEGDYEDSELVPPPPGTERTRAARASKPQAYASKRHAHHNKIMKEWPMRAYVELRQGNPYVFHREKRWTDPKFYTKEQK